MRRRPETLAAILLSVAAVATAWSSYQASRWTGEQAKAFAAATSVRVESTRASNLGNAQTQVDIAIFTEWVNARLQGDQRRETFYEERFRDEFRPAFQAWLDTDPFHDPTAPTSPFAMPEYRLAANAQATALEAAADRSAEAARTNVQRATNYVLGVVLFAIALFFAGISTKLTRPRIRAIILAMGWAVLIVTAAWIATFPISLSV
jgi:hypothetical protein